VTGRRRVLTVVRDAFRPEVVAPAPEYVHRTPEQRLALIAAAFGPEADRSQRERGNSAA
jgi:hypothetical protein